MLPASIVSFAIHVQRQAKAGGKTTVVTAGKRSNKFTGRSKEEVVGLVANAQQNGTRVSVHSHSQRKVSNGLMRGPSI